MKYQHDGFFKRVVKTLTDKEKLTMPVVIKEATENIQLLEQYQKRLKKTVDEQEITSLNQKIKLLELGIKGENSVLFELKNSFLPIHILHDIRIAHNDLKAQIDFIVLTRKFILVIEVKNYYGNILVNEKDEFIRQVYKGNRLAFQEGFYSPIRQVERQVKIFESYMRDMDAITRTPIKSVVVFSNHRTVIHTKKASKKVKEKILRVDSLVEYIKQELTMPSPVHFLDNRMKELSHYIKASHFAAVNEETDAIEMKLLEETIRQHNNENKDSPVIIRETQTDLEELLKRFRKKLSAEQDVKAYYIFNNRTLEELIIKQPCTLNDLNDIYGIGEVKINEFGEELINIIKKYRQTHKSKAPYRSESGAK